MSDLFFNFSLVYFILATLLLVITATLRVRGPAFRPTDTSAVPQAEEIVQEAEEQAARIVRETRFFTRAVQTDIERMLREASEQVTKTARANAAQLSEKMLRAAEQQLAGFTERLGQAGQKLEQNLANFAEQEHKQIHAELADFRKQRRAELESRLAEKLPGLVREATRRSIPLVEHRRLIAEALARAQREGWS
jgi:cell division septum initiation protein DivIVA